MDANDFISKPYDLEVIPQMFISNNVNQGEGVMKALIMFMSKKQGQNDESSETKPMSENIILNDQVQMLPLLK